LICKSKQIHFIGDMPFYITLDSADIWVHPELFSLDSKGKPTFIGGVPPDYFSRTGQLWGNPIYNWKKMQQTGFKWWVDRIRHNLKLYDLLRLDHFRGYVSYWQVKASAKTAKNGRWIKAPSAAFFKVVKSFFPSLPFIAENLGDIDEPVRDAIKRLDTPGMKVLLFAFDGNPDNPHLPKNHVKNAVVFTGTHDTNTVKGWFNDESSSKERRNLFKLIGQKVSAKKVSFEFIKLALASVADLSVIPLQDILGLDSKARMNNPSRAMHNWEWRTMPKQLTSEKIGEFADATIDNNRAD
jgi:4-alpha-glucanotransferase